MGGRVPNNNRHVHFFNPLSHSRPQPPASQNINRQNPAQANNTNPINQPPPQNTVPPGGQPTTIFNFPPSFNNLINQQNSTQAPTQSTGQNTIFHFPAYFNQLINQSTPQNPNRQNSGPTAPIQSTHIHHRPPMIPQTAFQQPAPAPNNQHRIIQNQQIQQQRQQQQIQAQAQQRQKNSIQELREIQQRLATEGVTGLPTFILKQEKESLTEDQKKIATAQAEFQKQRQAILKHKHKMTQLKEKKGADGK